MNLFIDSEDWNTTYVFCRRIIKIHENALLSIDQRIPSSESKFSVHPKNTINSVDYVMKKDMNVGT